MDFIVRGVSLTESDTTEQLSLSLEFPGSDSKESVHNVGDLGSIPGSGRSPGNGNGNPLKYSCLENSMDGGAWWATVHGVTKSQTRPSNFTLLCKSLSLIRSHLFVFAFITFALGD